MPKLLAIAALALLTPTIASADEQVFENHRLSAMVGVGMMGFTDPTTRDYANAGGAWEARIGFEANERIVLETAYIGSLQDISASGLSRNAQLVGTGVEANIRLDFLVGQFRPYAHVGGGWTRYDLSGSTSSTMGGTDSVGSVPVGLGIDFTYADVVLDLRGTYRATTGEDLITMPGSEDARLDTWSATMRAGFHF